MIERNRYSITSEEAESIAGVYKTPEWKSALKKWGRKLRRQRKSCKHTKWKSFACNGSCCPSCGTFIVDFGG
jgi:hypothetical protein